MIVLLPLTPSMLATMDVVPGATAVTVPALFTVATEGVALFHVTVLPPTSTPAALRAVAANGCVPPTASEAVPGVTVTVATTTGAGGVAPPPSPPPPQPTSRASHSAAPPDTRCVAGTMPRQRDRRRGEDESMRNGRRRSPIMRPTITPTKKPRNTGVAPPHHVAGTRRRGAPYGQASAMLMPARNATKSSAMP